MFKKYVGGLRTIYAIGYYVDKYIDRDVTEATHDRQVWSVLKSIESVEIRFRDLPIKLWLLMGLTFPVLIIVKMILMLGFKKEYKRL